MSSPTYLFSTDLCFSSVAAAPGVVGELAAAAPSALAAPLAVEASALAVDPLEFVMAAAPAVLGSSPIWVLLLNMLVSELIDALSIVLMK